jgi:hypothetical protein
VDLEAAALDSIADHRADRLRRDRALHVGGKVDEVRARRDPDRALVVNLRDRELRAALGQLEHDGAPDSARAIDDDRDPISKLHACCTRVRRRSRTRPAHAAAARAIAQRRRSARIAIPARFRPATGGSVRAIGW